MGHVPFHLKEVVYLVAWEAICIVFQLFYDSTALWERTSLCPLSLAQPVFQACTYVLPTLNQIFLAYKLYIAFITHIQ